MEGDEVMGGISALVKETPESPPLRPPREDTEKDRIYEPGVGSHQNVAMLAP